MVAKPKNGKLYARATKEAKAKFEVFPSAVASSWLVKRYKDLGGTYSGKKSAVRTKSRRSRTTSKKRERSARKIRGKRAPTRPGLSASIARWKSRQRK
jgi:hypothetical protein